MQIALLGFESEDELKRLIKQIECNNGHVSDIFDDCDAIVIKSGLILSNHDYQLIERYERKIVTEKWFYECISQKEYLDFTNFKFKNDLLKNKFESIESEYVLLQDPLLIFNECLFFISEEFEKETRDILNKAIALGSGIIFNKISPYTTHIICNSNKDNFSSKSLNFGKFFRPTLINPNWVIQCLKEKQLTSPEEYRPISSFQMLINESSQSTRNEIMLSNKIVSTTFKNESFFICKDSYESDEYLSIKEKILQNSGLIIEEKGNFSKNNKNKAKFIIINDGYSQNEMSNLIDNKVKNYQWITSHRYVDLCIEKRQLIEIETCGFIHVLPFHNKVPFKDFIEKEITVFFLDFGLIENQMLEYLIETLGGKCELNEKTTHVVCSKETVDPKRVSKLKKYNQDLLFVRTEWIMECLIDGYSAKEDKFLIQV